ncbi:hypothetical protein [Streptomyces sp. NPDC051546]|uniref:hypothetical protein n=1 Tax=Streptomyces sp. NPDC051546 TaxID=3365655 RepID=UPI0037A0CD5E
MATTGYTGNRGLRAGFAHLRAEYGRWWRTEDQSDNHIAHRVLNDQFRTWLRFQQRHKVEVQQNIGLLEKQQKLQRQAQLIQINAHRGQHRRGGAGGYRGHGGGMGASPMIAYRVMQWAGMKMRIAQQEFRHLEVTPQMLADTRGRLRSHRHTTAFLTITVLLILWIGLWALSALSALVVTVGAALVLTLMAWSAGRHPTRRRPPVPRLLFVPPRPPAHTQLAEADLEPEPFAIREAGNDPRAAREAIRRALKKHKAAVAEVLVPEPTTYGWKVPLVLESGTAGQLINVLTQVATTLRVGESRLLAQASDPEDAALVDLRVLTRDPFANPLPYPQRPPLSCSILNPLSLGMSLEGEATPVVLAGQHVIIVADTGGGKTAMVQTIAEYVTACHDAAIVDIDPAKRGLKALAPLAVMTARTPEESEAVLQSLLDRALRRIASMPPTQDMWIPTFQDPAILAVVEEYPKLTKQGKKLAVELLRLGREAMITEVIVTQDATEDTLGDAIAGVPGVRIMMPCRVEDVPLVVGRKDAVSKGWLPHLLVPSPEKDFPADAGRFYCVTPRHRDPVLRYVSPLPPDEAARRTKERLAAGRPTLDPAPPTPPAAPAPSSQQAASYPLIAQQLLAAFATHSNPELLTLAQLTEFLVASDPAVWGRWRGTKNERTRVGALLQVELKKAGLTVASIRRTDLPDRPMVYCLADVLRAVA